MTNMTVDAKSVTPKYRATNHVCYKYRPLRDGNGAPHPFTQQIFDQAKLFYATPKSFNDPFDCNLRLHVDNSTDEDWESYCEEIIARQPGMREKISLIRAEKRWRIDSIFRDSAGQRNAQILYEESSVCCLSKKANSIPMFSYYADSHRGIAVEFSFDTLTVPCGISLGTWPRLYEGKVVFNDVKYPESFPELNYLKLRKMGNALVENLMFTKHHEWAHEHEFRIFRRGVPAGIASFDRKSVTRVILGCNTNKDDESLVRNWLMRWPSPVALARAERAHNRFELDIVAFDSVGGKA